MATRQLRRVLDPDGRPQVDYGPAADTVERCYRLQVLARTLDEKAVKLSRQGRVSTYAPLRGHEAVQTGAAAALSAEDYLFPTYRDHAMFLARGVPLRDVVLHLRGHGNYVDRRDPGSVRTFPPTIPIATQLPHAVGAAMAADYKGDDAVALASFGDGATSEGDFHEAMNFAGVFDAPVVFLCQNNQWAISTPVERQTASATIAQKADAYGFDGRRVDGNDTLAVYEAVRAAIRRARSGGGPTLVEAVTYRRGAHTTTDDPTNYRDEDDIPDWLDVDPLDRTRRYLEREHGWTDDDEDAAWAWAEQAVADAVDAAESHPGLDSDDVFAHVYDEEPEAFADQREEMRDDPDALR
jgi:pyruvate dehydrogenase E1 component alpha subunit